MKLKPMAVVFLAALLLWGGVCGWVVRGMVTQDEGKHYADYEMVVTWSDNPDSLSDEHLARLGAWMIELNAMSKGEAMRSLMPSVRRAQLGSAYWEAETRLGVRAQLIGREELLKSQQRQAQKDATR